MQQNFVPNLNIFEFPIHLESHQKIEELLLLRHLGIRSVSYAEPDESAIAFLS